MDYRKNDRWSSYRFYSALQRQKSPNALHLRDFRNPVIFEFFNTVRQKRPVTITFPEERLTSSPPSDCVRNLDHACEPQFIDLRAAQSEQPLEYLVVSCPSPSPSQPMCPGGRTGAAQRLGPQSAPRAVLRVLEDLPETKGDLPGAPSCGPEFFEQCYVFRIPTHGRCYTPTANYRLVDTRIARRINPAWHSRGCSQPLISSAGHLTLTEIPKRTVQR